MTTKNYQKHKEKLRKEARKNIKIFLKKKKTKGKKRSEKDIKIFPKKKKKKKRQYHTEPNENLSEEQQVEYMRNDCLAHKK